MGGNAVGFPRREAPTWFRKRASGPGVDWGWLAYWSLVGAFVGVSVAVLLTIAPRRLGDVAALDSTLYFRATEAWLSGGNPWQTRSPGGIPFAGPPTSLLISLPLIPFGPAFAPPFWAITGLLGWLLTMRRLHLGPWWIIYPPFLEGWFAGSPDPALMGLVVVGAGAISALAKPYSIPAMLALGRWRALALAVIAGVLSIVFLPWAQFISEITTVQRAFAEYSRNVSAWGEPPMMVAVAVSLLMLGKRRGLELAVPGLWPGAQLHYLVFSAGAGADSAFIAFVLAVPKGAPVGIVVYALATVIGPLILRRTGYRLAPIWRTRA